MAIVSSTTPRFGPRCPPVRETHDTSSLRTSAARLFSPSASRSRTSAGLWTERRTALTPTSLRNRVGPARRSTQSVARGARRGHGGGPLAVRDAHLVAPAALRGVQAGVGRAQRAVEVLPRPYARRAHRGREP